MPDLESYGTSEGAYKAWEIRQRAVPKPPPPKGGSGGGEMIEGLEQLKKIFDQIKKMPTAKEIPENFKKFIGFCYGTYPPNTPFNPGAKILKDGKMYEPRIGTPRMTPKACYQNAAMNCFSHDGYKYIEGYTSVMGLPISHAWNVDANGKAVDYTLDRLLPGQEYVGVEVPRATVMAIITSKWFKIDVGAGVLGTLAYIGLRGRDGDEGCRQLFNRAGKPMNLPAIPKRRKNE